MIVMRANNVILLAGLLITCLGPPCATAKAELPEGALTLEQCLAYAAEHNYDIMDARRQLEKQAGFLLEARGFLGPKVVATATLDRNELRGFGDVDGAAPVDRSWGSGIEVQQPLYTGGEGTALRRQGQVLQQAAQYELQAVNNQTVLLVKQKFYDVLLHQGQLKVQQQSVGLLEQQLKLERDRVAAGTTSNFNVLRAEVELANARAPLISARNGIRLALEDLARALGLRPGAGAAVPFSVRGELLFEDQSYDLENALFSARRERPELKRLALLKLAQDQGVAIEEARRRPRVDLVSGYDVQSSPLENRLSDTVEGWRFGARGSWRIFDSFETSGRIKQAQAESGRAAVALARELLDVELEVRRALSNIEEARELVRASSEVVKQAEESYRLVQARLETGAARQIDVLDAQVALTQARTNRLQALHSFSIAKSEVEWAVGGRW